MKIDLIHNKIFYLILLGAMFLIPKNVFADIKSASLEAIYFKNNNGNVVSTVTSPTNTISNINGVLYKAPTNTSYYNITYVGDNLNFITDNSHYDLTFSFFLKMNADAYEHSDYFSKVVVQSRDTSNTYVNYNCTYTIRYDYPYTNYVYYTASCPSVLITKDKPYFNVSADTRTLGFYNIDAGWVKDVNFVKKSDNEIVNGLEEMKKEQEKTNDKLDEIQNTDISDSDKTMPDDSSYKDYSSTQDELLDKTKEADLDSLDVGLDVNSSSWVWDTLTSLIQSHSVVFGMVIAILSIGVIKLVLGR